jgi:hypothetical protein
VGALTMDLDLGIISEGEKRLKKKLILDYIYANLKHHNFWAYRYFFCELLALLNVVGVYGGDHAYYSYTCMYTQRILWRWISILYNFAAAQILHIS